MRLERTQKRERWKQRGKRGGVCLQARMGPKDSRAYCNGRVTCLSEFSLLLWEF